MSRPQRVLLDSCALMAPFQWGFNLDMELERLLGVAEVAVPTGAKGELERLSENDRDARSAALLAQRYAAWEPGPVRDDDVKDLGAVDAALLAGARGGWLVVTMDRPLLKRLKEQGHKAISLREQSRLEFF